MHRSRRTRFPDVCPRTASFEVRLRGSTLAALSVLVALVVPLVLSVSACVPAEPAQMPSEVAVTRGPPLQFEYVTLDGQPLSTATLSGRISVIGFVTTYDIASHAQVRFLADLVRSHKPRLNGAILIMERPENRPMVEAFVEALAPPFPAALADALTIAGQGPFTGLHHVPSIVILDRQGREAWRHLGLADKAAIEAALRDVERREGSAEAP